MALILLRGLGRESSHWGSFMSQLVKQDHRGLIDALGGVVAPDCPGSGVLNGEPVPGSISEMCSQIRAQLSSDCFSGRAHNTKHVIVGLSMGGMVALDWAARFPCEVQSVVLINSSSADSAPTARLRPLAWPAIFLSLFRSKFVRESLLLKQVSNDRLNYASRIEQWQAIQRLRPVSNIAMLKLLLLASRVRVCDKLELPGLVLASRNDRLVSYRCSELLARKFNWPIKRHVFAGHDLSMDDPEWVISNILGFLADA